MLILARYLLAAAFTLTFAFAPFAWAQPWPVKPIRLIVNYPAGGTSDLMARAFSTKLAETLGQPVVIENRGGAAGNIGLEVVAKSAPDGYTLLASSGSPIVVGPHLYKLNFDVARDLVPIVPMARILTLLVVRPGLPVHSVAELIAYAREAQLRIRGHRQHAAYTRRTDAARGENPGHPRAVQGRGGNGHGASQQPGRFRV
jgi:tripartite-type tricarboxylate transporter receptor subunit TctC